MFQPMRHRRPGSFALIVGMVIAVSACTSAGAPAAASPAAPTPPAAATAAAPSSAAPSSAPPTVAPTVAATPLPSVARTAAAASASVPPVPSASTSSGNDGYGDGGYGGYGGGTPSPAATPAGSAATATLGTATITGIGAVLTGPDGKTLYTYKPDGTGASACEGGCAKAWPPVAATTVPALPAGATGKVSLIARSDGSKQVAYNGHPLYAYTGDTDPGQANGQGLGGVWFVAAP
jgi:predicted lipoprotein with Yx(FWY)xxD motif